MATSLQHQGAHLKTETIKDMRKLLITILAATTLTSTGVMAQRVLTLEECREMAIESEAGRGTKVTLSLKLAKP